MRQKHVSGGVSEAGPTRDLNVTLLQYAEYVKLASRGGLAGLGTTEGRDRPQVGYQVYFAIGVVILAAKSCLRKC